MLHLDAGAANAYMRAGIHTQFRLLNHLRDHLRDRIIKKPDGTYEAIVFARKTNHGDLGFDADLIAVYFETCERTGDAGWVRMEEERRGTKVYLVPTAVAEEAIDTYRARAGMPLFTRALIIDD